MTAPWPQTFTLKFNTQTIIPPCLFIHMSHYHRVQWTIWPEITHKLTLPWYFGAASWSILISTWASGLVLFTNKIKWTFKSPLNIFCADSWVNSTTIGRRCLETNERSESLVTTSNFMSARPSSNCRCYNREKITQNKKQDKLKEHVAHHRKWQLNFKNSLLTLVQLLKSWP